MSDATKALLGAMSGADKMEIILATRYATCLKAINTGLFPQAAALNSELQRGLQKGQLNYDEIIAYLMAIEQAISEE